MTNKTWTWIGVALIFLLGAFSFWGLNKIFTPAPPVVKSDTIKITNTDTIRFKVKDTIYKKIIKSDTITKKIWVHDTVMSHTDSIKIIRAFFKKTGINRIILDNDTIYLELRDSITQNQIISSVGKYVWKMAVQTINNNPQQPLKSMLFIGGGLGANIDLFSLNGRITFKTKKNVLYTPEIEYIPALSKHPIFKFAVQFKIW